MLRAFFRLPRPQLLPYRNLYSNVRCRSSLVNKKKTAKPITAQSILDEHGLSKEPPVVEKVDSTITDVDGKKMSKFQKLKTLWKQHGVTFVSLYGTAWLFCYAPILAGLQYTGVDGIKFLDVLGVDAILPESFDYHKVDPIVINAYLAVEINGFLDILRLPTVLYLTPKVSSIFKVVKKS